jgi:hypothetical protein
MTVETLHPRFITDANGARTEVILPIEEFYELLEDMEDLAVVASRRDEETIPMEEIIKELGLQDNV